MGCDKVATTVEMPKLGNTVQECLLSAWLRHKGDSVAAGDIIAEVETDKASFEIVAPADGILLDTYVDEGAIVPVFTTICAIGAAGEDVAGAPGAAQRSRRRGGPPRPGACRRQPRDARAARSDPAGPDARRSDARPPEADAGRAPLSPRARRYARDHYLSQRPAAGSGPGGRILEADLRDLYYTLPRASETAAQEMTRGHLAGGAGSGIGGMIRAGDLDASEAPISSVRRTIADRLRESVNSTAQYTLNGSANAGGLLAVRRLMKSAPVTAGHHHQHLVAFCRDPGPAARRPT